MDQVVYERMAEHEDTHWWFVARRKIIARLIRIFVRRDRDLKILEVGCGTGGNLAMLKEFGPITSTECDENARKFAIRKSGMDVRSDKLPALENIPETDFDLVVLLDVLEHVEDDLGALKALTSRQQSEGKLLITVPAHPWLWSSHDTVHHHFRRYTPATLRKVAEDAGYRVEAIGYYNTLLFPLVVSVRFLKKMLGRETADDVMPGPFINGVLKTVFGLEQSLVGRVPMPTGLSLYLVGEIVDQ